MPVFHRPPVTGPVAQDTFPGSHPRHEVNMPTDAKSHGISPEILEEIVERFRPIEHLFDVMGAADSGIQGVFVRRWAEIGMHLATSFQEYIDKMVATSRNDD